MKKCKCNKKSMGGPIARPKPVAAKAGVTRNGKRRYCSRGKLK